MSGDETPEVVWVPTCMSPTAPGRSYYLDVPGFRSKIGQVRFTGLLQKYALLACAHPDLILA